jgi:hypothetical protein
LELAIKNAINNAVAGMNIQTICLGENKDDQFNFSIWGTVIYHRHSRWLEEAPLKGAL